MSERGWAVTALAGFALCLVGALLFNLAGDIETSRALLVGGGLGFGGILILVLVS